jgi:hypothetical protein
MPYAHYMLKYTGSAYALPAAYALAIGQYDSAATLGTIAFTSYMYHSHHTNPYWAALDKTMVYVISAQGLYNSTVCPYRAGAYTIIAGVGAATYWVGYVTGTMSFCIRYGSIYHALFLHLIPQFLALYVLSYYHG